MESHGMALKIRMIIDRSFMNFDIESVTVMHYSTPDSSLFWVLNSGVNFINLYDEEE